MKTKHDKAIDKLIQKDLIVIWWNSDCDCQVDYLCHTFAGTKYKFMWRNYWRQINDKNFTNINEYFKICKWPNKITSYMKNLLRLLIVEDFKKYVKKYRKRYGLD